MNSKISLEIHFVDILVFVSYEVAVKNDKNLLENSGVDDNNSQKFYVELNNKTKNPVSFGLWNAKAIQKYGNTNIGRDLAYAIVARLPHLPIKRCGPRISNAVISEDFLYCLDCVMQQKLILREVFCEWPLQKFDVWWLQCQEARSK